MRNTNISWTDHTHNHWVGCTKVSPGCLHCYAETMNHRWGEDNWGKGKARRLTTTENRKKPLRINEEGMICDNCGFDHMGPICARCEGRSRRQRIFSFSMADWLDDEVPIEWTADFLNLVRVCSFLDWQLVTKRPENWRARLHAASRVTKKETCDWICSWLDGLAPSNVWVGTSVESPDYNVRIMELLNIPAIVRFLSVEPMLGEVRILGANSRIPFEYDATGLAWSESNCRYERLKPAGIHWVICGGESGSPRREMNMQWAISLAQQCRIASIPFFMKQDSAFKPGQQGRIPDALWNRKEFPR